MSKHTPGPWRRCGGATPKYCSIHSASGYIVFGMADRSTDIEQGKQIQAPDMWEQQANAQLMSASPELLSAAKEIYEWMNNLPIPTTGCTAKMQVLYDAIAKAEGKS